MVEGRKDGRVLQRNLLLDWPGTELAAIGVDPNARSRENFSVRCIRRTGATALATASTDWRRCGRVSLRAHRTQGDRRPTFDQLFPDVLFRAVWRYYKPWGGNGATKNPLHALEKFAELKTIWFGGE